MNQHRLTLILVMVSVALFALAGLFVRSGGSFDVAAQIDIGGGEPPSSVERPADDEEQQAGPQPVLVELAPAAPEGLSLTSVRIAGSTLRPREDDVAYNVSAGGGCTYASGGDPSTVWNAPIWLPPGATVHSLRIYYYDASSANAVVWFTIYDLYGNVVEEWSVTSTGANGNGYQDTAVIDQPVDYSLYSYAVNWRPEAIGEDIRLCGFRIFYEAPLFPLGFLPTITR